MTGTHIDTIASSTGVPIAVRDFGGSGLPIVLIHGLGRSLVDWIRFAPLLTARHRVIAWMFVAMVPPATDRGRGRWPPTMSPPSWSISD